MSDRNEIVKGYFDEYIERLEAYEHVGAIKEEKRQRIIMVALEEFAANDYRNVSTNTIVAKANVSKGLLFRYFKDKAGLFAYLQTYVAQKLTKEVLGQTDFGGDNVFETLKRLTNVKLEALARYPLEVAFLVRTMKSDLPVELRGDIDDSVTRSFDSLTVIVNAIDETRLKPDLDKEMVVKLLDWFVVGMTNEILAEIGPETSIEYYEELNETVDEYFDFLRDLVYVKREARGRARHFR